MKHIKTFEQVHEKGSFSSPTTDDYVITKHDLTKIGQIKSTVYTQMRDRTPVVIYCVKFPNSEIIKKGFEIDNNGYTIAPSGYDRPNVFTNDEIEYCSKKQDELEPIASANKYNL